MDLALDPTSENPEAVSSSSSDKLQISPAYSQEMGKAGLMLLNEMLAQIQSLGISDDLTLVYD